TAAPGVNKGSRTMSVTILSQRSTPCPDSSASFAGTLLRSCFFSHGMYRLAQAQTFSFLIGDLMAMSCTPIQRGRGPLGMSLLALARLALEAPLARPGFQAPPSFETGPVPVSVAVGDFNGDGIPDLATANQGDNSVSILLGRGDGTFQPAVNYA